MKHFILFLNLLMSCACLSQSDSLETKYLIEKTLRESDDKLHEAKLAYEEAKSAYVNEKSAIYAIMAVISVVSIGSFFSVIFLAKKNINKKIDSIADGKIMKLTSLLEKHGSEFSLMQQSKVLVIFPYRKTLPKYVDIVISEFNCERHPIQSIDELINIDSNTLKKFSIIIFYNENDNSWPISENVSWMTSREHEEFVKFVNKTPSETGILYFGKSLDIDPIDEDQRQLVAVSNFPSTLFGNLLNLLKLHHAIITK